jgi:hypothetical protein
MPSSRDFLETFGDRRRCFADLLELSQRQLALVEQDDYPQLLGLLGGKQQIIGRLELIGRSRPRLWEEWREERDRLVGDQRRKYPGTDKVINGPIERRFR